MKKLLALSLALLTIASFAACKKEDKKTDDLDDYRQEEVVYTSYTDGKSVFHFERIDTETVAIVGYEGPTELHEITVPAVVYTGSDKTSTAKKVVRIEAQAFKEVSSIKKATIPEGVTSIGRYAFAYCAHLETVEFPKSLNTIEYGAFYESGLTSLTFPELTAEELAAGCGITALQDSIFWRCNSLKEVTIPGYVKSVGVATFFECQSLEKVVLSEGVETVGDCAFVKCVNLEELHLPSTLKTGTDPLDDMAFLGSEKLTIDGVHIPDASKLPEGSKLVEYKEEMEKYLKSADEVASQQ